MPVPPYQDLLLPVLEITADGSQTVPDIVPRIQVRFGITDEEAEELLGSGRQTLIANRTHWARHYLYRAGLLTQIRRGHYEVSDRGRAVLAERPGALSNADLEQFPEFRDFVGRNDDGKRPVEPSSQAAAASMAGTLTPEDAMESADRTLTDDLVEQLRTLLLEVSPSRFESIIVEVLVAMGYGGGAPGMGRAIGKSGDGGIDGVIDEDPLGLDAVYIQAKRYAHGNVVGERDIRDFIGALTSHGATKGVFVTTSSFTAQARRIVERITQRIVLLDGNRLARLMIAHDVGVRRRVSYHIRSVDEDFFGHT